MKKLDKIYKIGIVNNFDYELEHVAKYFSYSEFSYVIVYKDAISICERTNAAILNIWLKEKFVPFVKDIMDKNPKCKILFFPGYELVPMIDTELPENVIILNEKDYETEDVFFTTIPGLIRDNKVNVLVSHRDIDKENLGFKYDFVIYRSNTQTENFEVKSMDSSETRLINMNIKNKDNINVLYLL